MSDWTRDQLEAFDHAIDLLTGVFLNEKASRIRLLGYRLVLQDLDPLQVLPALRRMLETWDTMPSPHQIREQIVS